MKNLKKGDTVVMRNCGESEFPKYKDKEWICSEDSFLNGGEKGTEVVFLEGFSGCFACDCLNKIMFVTNNGSTFYDLIAKEEIIKETDTTIIIIKNGKERRKAKQTQYEKYFSTNQKARVEICNLIGNKEAQARLIMQEIEDLENRLSNH